MGGGVSGDPCGRNCPLVLPLCTVGVWGDPASGCLLPADHCWLERGLPPRCKNLVFSSMPVTLLLRHNHGGRCLVASAAPLCPCRFQKKSSMIMRLVWCLVVALQLLTTQATAITCQMCGLVGTSS